MSDIQPQSIGYLSHAGDYSLRNNRALSGVTQLWSDAFARAMAEQIGEDTAVSTESSAVATSPTGEPLGGISTLGKIVDQRECVVDDNRRVPPEPLHLPIAEFELDLLDKPAEPFSVGDMIEQQRHLDFDSGWVRPLVLDPPQANPGPAPQPRPLHLPIAELEWDLADKPALPFDPETMVEQQRHLDYDNGWARPLILHNLRLAA